MIITIKAQEYKELSPGILQIQTNVEDYKAMLQQHSPNLLVSYLNDKYGTKIQPVNYTRKEAANGR